MVWRTEICYAPFTVPSLPHLILAAAVANTASRAGESTGWHGGKRVKKSYLRDTAQGQERSGFACYTGHKIGSSSYLTKKQCLAFITPWWFFVCTNLQGICWPYAWKENTRTLLSPLSNNLGSQDMKSKRSSSRNRSLHPESFAPTRRLLSLWISNFCPWPLARMAKLNRKKFFPKAKAIPPLPQLGQSLKNSTENGVARAWTLKKHSL